MIASKILSEKGRVVFTVNPSQTVVEAAQALDQHNVGVAVVVDGEGAPIGVFSERDLARQVARNGADALSLLVAAVMSRSLVIADPSASIDDLMATMTARRVRHVIIMDGSLMIGLVSIGDVVKRKIASAEAEAESLKAYIEGA